MTEEQGYNGWKNYETWVMALWIDNDRGSYEYSRQLVREAREIDAADPGGRTLVGTLADGLKSWIKEEYDQAAERLTEAGSMGGMFSDLLGAAWSEVDWYEIAENYLSE